MRTSSAAENDRILRTFEREVLDSYHQSLPLMRRPAAARLYAVMAAYDSMFVSLRAASIQLDETAIGSIQRMRTVVQSLTAALLWVISGVTPVFPEPAADRDLIDDGGNFLLHAKDYFQLSAFHAMYSRGLISIECDEERRLVRFVRPSHETFPHAFASGVLGQKANKPIVSGSEHIIFRFSQFLERLSHTLTSGHLQLTEPHQLSSPEMRSVAQLFTPIETLELSDDVDLLGFSLGQFRTYWLTLHSWSIAASELYLRLADSGVAQERCMPTQILPLTKFYHAMEVLTALPSPVIQSITSRLTYDQTDPRSDIFLQPLICSSDGISWCPLVIKQSRPERNMFKLMSRSAALRNAAANIIGAREGPMLKELGLLLAKRRGYDYKLNCTIRSATETAEIDLLAYNRKAPSEVLLVEGKAVLAVDDVAEVQAATDQFKKAKEQLERTTRILSSALSHQRKRTLFPFVDWAQVKTYHSLVVTPDSNPLSNFDEHEVPVITLELIRSQLRNRDFKSPSTIWQACRRRDWLKPLSLEGEDFYSSMTVGSVTYEFPARG